jgi:hypothetical protein
MLKINVKNSKSFVDKKFLLDNYGFFIVNVNKKSILSKIFNYGFIMHISKFKYFLNLKMSGNFYFCFFDRNEFFVKFELLKNVNVQIYFISINNFFLNCSNILKIKNLDFLNIFIFFIGFFYCLINILSFFLYFLNDLNFFFKNLISEC